MEVTTLIGFPSICNLEFVILNRFPHSLTHYLRQVAQELVCRIEGVDAIVKLIDSDVDPIPRPDTFTDPQTGIPGGIRTAGGILLPRHHRPGPPE
jgi:hypothetical protein